jgi:sodium transport system permease protein
MNDAQRRPAWWSNLGRVARLTRKELRETLRDRRTVITLVLMPLLVYPLISISFNKSVLVNAQQASKIVYSIGVGSAKDAEVLAQLLDWGDQLLRDQERTAAGTTPAIETETGTEYLLGESESIGIEPLAGPLEAQVANNVVHVAVRLQYAAPPTEGAKVVPPVACELVYRANSPASRRALRFVDDRLRLVNEASLRSRLARTRQWAGVPATISHKVVATGHAMPFSLATLVPLVLILMTITGAVYPAIDLTAGERERGTLETLIAAPISRMALLGAKYIAVLTVAVLTAMVNLAAMTVTIMSSGLHEQLFPEGLSIPLIAEIFGLMVLFAAFFSAILLALTSFARSFKEAQAYLIPVMLLAISPGLLSLMPGLQLTRLLALVPLVNIVLLSRDLLEASMTPVTALVVIASTAVYAVGALLLASRVFGHDALLYASRGSWSDLLQRPAASRSAPSTAATLACLACMFPCFFLLGNFAVRMSGDLGTQLALSGAVSVVVFAGCPLLFAIAQRVRVREGFQLRRAPWGSLLGAAVLGLALWPLAYELFLVGQLIGLAPADRNQFAEVEVLLRGLERLSPVLVLLMLAVVQPMCEEFFFRGYLFHGLRERFPGRSVIVVSALLFGLFHVLHPATLTPERFLPSTFLGLFLGWLCYRTGSVLPGMVLHVVHNGLLLTIAQQRDWITARGWDVENSQHVPAEWLWGAAAVAVVGAIAVFAATRTRLAGSPARTGTAQRPSP